MKRIMVIGISPGVGKSTFARELGKILHMNVYHLDSIYWKPNWIEATLDEFSKAQKEIVTRERWIIEGNYSNTFDIRAEYADTIIYLELPLYLCLYRVIKRWITNIGKTRPDMGEGCKEKIDWDFIKFIYTTFYSRKRKMEQRFQHYKQNNANKLIIELRSKKEIKGFLNNHLLNPTTNSKNNVSQRD
jgi:adenylate kinase family enzyme